MKFKVVSAFGDRAFEPIIDWARQELHLNLTTCAADSHMPRVENAIKFVNETLRSIQCEILLEKIPRRLTIEMLNVLQYFSTLSEENQECIQ